MVKNMAQQDPSRSLLSDRAPHAAGQAVAALIAGVVFVASVGTVFWYTQERAVDSSSSTEALSRAEADALLALIVGSPGSDWDQDADLLGMSAGGRFGLRASTGGISLTKMDLMQGAMLQTAATNGLLDYAEAQKALGMQTASGIGTQFHLRIYPVGLNETLADLDLSHIRTAYIGDWQKLDAVTVTLNTDQRAMVAQANTKLNTSTVAGTFAERQMLKDLGLGFDDEVHITTNYPNVVVNVALGVNVPITTLVDATLLAGDVYPDQKNYIQNVLPSRLGQYDLLIIGSGVDQSTLTADAVKNGIKDWVLAGGTLMVMGSASQNFQWLQPLFQVGTGTANGNGQAPDVNHPLLKVPHTLDWPSFPSSYVWQIDPDDEEMFQRVLVLGPDEILAVSEEGAFGAGRIFLTSFQPRAIATAINTEQATSLLHNMILFSDREYLFLDYGPPVPADAHVASAVRHSFVEDDDIGRVPVRIELLLWKG
jgi:hypothetical protein